MNSREFINSLDKSDIIRLKEHRDNAGNVEVLKLLCLIKGKTPTWFNSKEILNPLIFNLEFSSVNVENLKKSNVERAYQHFIKHKKMFHGENLSIIDPAARKLLDWVTSNIVMYKHKCYNKSKNSESSILPVLTPKRISQSSIVLEINTSSIKILKNKDTHHHSNKQLLKSYKPIRQSLKFKSFIKNEALSDVIKVSPKRFNSKRPKNFPRLRLY